MDGRRKDSYRATKVARLRAQIRSGEYYVSERAIAEAVLERARIERHERLCRLGYGIEDDWSRAAQIRASARTLTAAARSR
jgi:hypothetical protein